MMERYALNADDLIQCATAGSLPECLTQEEIVELWAPLSSAKDAAARAHRIGLVKRLNAAALSGELDARHVRHMAKQTPADPAGHIGKQVGGARQVTGARPFTGFGRSEWRAEFQTPQTPAPPAPKAPAPIYLVGSKSLRAWLIESVPEQLWPRDDGLLWLWIGPKKGLAHRRVQSRVKVSDVSQANGDIQNAAGAPQKVSDDELRELGEALRASANANGGTSNVRAVCTAFAVGRNHGSETYRNAWNKRGKTLCGM